MTNIPLAELREALDEAAVDHARTMIDPLEESRVGRVLAAEPRRWVPVEVIERMVDELAAAAVARESQKRAATRARPGVPMELEKMIELVEDSSAAGRTGATYRDELIATLHRWRARARTGKVYYWDEGGS